MSKRILHLSHTDIRSDSRILKELDALEKISGVEIAGVGVSMSEGAAASKKAIRAKIISIRLFSKSFTILPRPIRYGVNMCELTFRFLAYGLRFKPDIVHCHDTLVLPVGVIIKILSRCKLIYDAHELESNKNGQTRILSKATLSIEKLAWSRIDLLISVSDSINSWYLNNLGEKKHLLVLNSPDISLGSGIANSKPGHGRYFHETFNIPAKKMVFLYIGILSQGRGIEICLRAFAQKSVDTHVVFMGYGQLASLVKEYQNKYKNIHLHDAVPHEMVVALAKHADVGLCFIENISLSDYYSLPNKLFEYAFSGLPILASNFPEIRRVVQEYRLGWCCEVTEHDVYREINRIKSAPLPTPNDRLDDLSWSAQADRLRNAYIEILKADLN